MRRPAWGYMLLAPFGAVAVGLLVVPAGQFLAYSFLSPVPFGVRVDPTLANYRQVFADPTFWRLLGNSFAVAGITGALAVPVGYFLALHLRFSAGRSRGPLLMLIVVAVLGGYLVRLYAWRILLGSNGVLSSFLPSVGLPASWAAQVLFTRAAVVLALVNVYVPFVAVIAYGGLLDIRDDLLHAARDLGAGPVATFARVVLPLSGRALYGSFAIVFLLTAADYVTPQLLGGARGVMVGVAIYDQFVRLGNWPLGAAMSVVAVGLAGAVVGTSWLGLRAVGVRRG